MPITNPDKVLLPVVGGRLMAEVGSFLMAAGTVPLLQNATPHTYHKAIDEVAKTVVEPRLAWFEKHMEHLPAFTNATRQMKHAKDDHEKARIVAEVIVNFGAMAAIGFAGHAVTLHAATRGLGLPEITKTQLLKTVVFDKSVAYAGIFAMQKLCPDTTQKATDRTSDMLANFIGTDNVTNLVQWKLPEAVGGLAGSLALANVYKKALAHNASVIR